jgi:hypothetical protein
MGVLKQLADSRRYARNLLATEHFQRSCSRLKYGQAVTPCSRIRRSE